MIPPVPTKNDPGTSTAVPTNIEAGRTPPAPTRKEAGMTPEKPTNSTQNGTAKPDLPATASSKRSSSDDNTEGVDDTSWFLVLLSLDPDYIRMLDDERKLLAHHERDLRNKAIPIFQWAVHEDPQLIIEARAQITVAIYTICEAIVWFNSWLRNILYFASGERNRTADMEGGRRKSERKMWESLWFSSESTFVSFLWVYGFSFGI